MGKEDDIKNRQLIGGTIIDRSADKGWGAGRKPPPCFPSRSVNIPPVIDVSLNWRQPSGKHVCVIIKGESDEEWWEAKEGGLLKILQKINNMLTYSHKILNNFALLTCHKHLLFWKCRLSFPFYSDKIMWRIKPSQIPIFVSYFTILPDQIFPCWLH